MQLEVTQDHIDKGWKANGVKCPVAYAFTEKGYNCCIGTTALFADVYPGCEFFCDNRLEKWILDFDAGNKVSPFTLELDEKNKEAIFKGS